MSRLAIVAIVGAIAAGKSTLRAQLADHYPDVPSLGIDDYPGEGRQRWEGLLAALPASGPVIVESAIVPTRYRELLTISECLIVEVRASKAERSRRLRERGLSREEAARQLQPHRLRVRGHVVWDGDLDALTARIEAIPKWNSGSVFSESGSLTARPSALSLPAAQKSRRRPLKTTEKGYGTRHQRTRERWAPKVAAGLVSCARCGGLIVPGTPWDLGHVDGDKSRYAGPEHRGCNRATARHRADQQGSTRRHHSRVW